MQIFYPTSSRLWDVIYDQPSDKSLLSRIESFQDNYAWAKTRAITSSSREKFYQELMLEYLNQRRWMRRLYLLYKVLSPKQPACIHDLFHQCGNLLSIQIHLTPSLLEQNASRTRFSQVLSVIGISSIQIF